MPNATVTSKGQVTIPKDVREQLKLKTGDEITFFVEPDGSVKFRPRKVALDQLLGSLGRMRKSKKTLTLGEMDEAIAKAVKERHKRILKRQSSR